MTNGTCLSVPQGEKSMRRMVVKAMHSFPWITLACVTHREWGFGELGLEFLSQRRLEIVPRFTEGKWCLGRWAGQPGRAHSK